MAVEKILELKSGNEVIEFYKNEEMNNYFVLFGAKLEGKSNMYEMSLSDKDLDDIYLMLRDIGQD